MRLIRNVPSVSVDFPWKIVSLPEPFGTRGWQLYDLSSDPGELIDLGEQNTDKLNELVALWEQYKTDNGVLDISLDLSDSFN